MKQGYKNFVLFLLLFATSFFLDVDKVSITDQKKKFESIGWQVLEVDGHSQSEIFKAIEASKKETNKPSLIIAKSTIGKNN